MYFVLTFCCGPSSKATLKNFRDLRIVFFRSNRITNRICHPFRFRIESSNQIFESNRSLLYTLQLQRIFNPSVFCRDAHGYLDIRITNYPDISG